MNRIQWIKFKWSTASESIQNGQFYSDQFSNFSWLAQPGIMAADPLWFRRCTSMSWIKCINYYNLFFPGVFSQSMHRTVLKEKKPAAWQAKLSVKSCNEADMCSSCFSTTKYKCLKTKIPICNCSIFEEHENSPG